MACEFSQELDEGSYVVCTLHTWLLKRSGDYSVFLSSSHMTNITNLNSSAYPEFLKDLFLDYSETKNLGDGGLYSVFMLGKDVGMACMHIKAKREDK